MSLPKMVRLIFFKGHHCDGVWQWWRQIGFHPKYSKEEGIYSQGAGESSVDGKVLRGNIKGKG